MSVWARRGGVVLALLIVLTAGLARMYWPFVERPAEMKFFGYLDAWVYTGPVLFYGDRVLAEGEIPTWNPYVFCGQPIAGNPQYLLFYPPNTLRSLLTPGPTPWNTNVGIVILLMLHSLWAGLGAYLLGRAHSLSRAASFCAGAFFVFSAPFTQRLLLHHHLVMVISWLPWTWLALRNVMHATDTRRAAGWCVLLGLSFGMAILAGSPQMTFLVGMSLGLYWLIMRVQDLFADWRRGKTGEGLRGIARDVALGTLAVALSAAIAAALVLPAIGLARETPRATAKGENIEAGLSHEKWTLTEVLSIYPGSANHEGIKAIGASGLLLCVIGLFSVARREVLFLSIMALLLFDASDVHSRFMLQLTSHITPFPISSPGRTMMLGALPLALLAGLGVDRLRAAMSPKLLRVGASMLLLVTYTTMFEAAYRRMQVLIDATGYDPYPMALLGIGIAILLLVNLAIWFPARRAFVITAVVLLFVIFAIMFVAAYRRMQVLTNLTDYDPYPMALLGISIATFLLINLAIWYPTRRAFVIAAAVLALLEPVAWRSMWSFSVTAGRGHFYRFGLDAARAHPDFHPITARESVRYPNTALYTLTPQINGYDPLSLHGFRELVAPHEEPIFFRGIIETQRRSVIPHLLLKRPFWLQREYIRGPIPGAETVFAPTTTAYIENPPALSVPEIKATESPQMISANITSVPLPIENHIFHAVDGVVGTECKIWMPPRDTRRHTVLRLHVISDCKAELEVRLPQRIMRGESELMAALQVHATDGTPVALDVPLPDVDASLLELQTFYMDIGDKIELVSAELLLDQQDEFELITVLKQSASTTELEVRDLPAHRILSFIDFNYPGWHAYLDGQEVPILHVFSHFKGVEVPPGTHRVRFEFRPRVVPISICISIASFAVALMLLVWAFRRAPSRAFGVHSEA